MKKYILLLIGGESTYPIFETDDFDEFTKRYQEELIAWGVERIIPVKKLTPKVIITEDDPDIPYGLSFRETEF